jgi:5-methylcytosine-specific restriction endonuclease McrA
MMPMNREDYPPDWEAISRAVKDEQRWQCAFCGATHGMLHPLTGALVILTTAHLDHDTRNNARENLRALCQRCHNRYDRLHRNETAARTRRGKKRNHEMDLDPVTEAITDAIALSYERRFDASEESEMAPPRRGC